MIMFKLQRVNDCMDEKHTLSTDSVSVHFDKSQQSNNDSMWKKHIILYNNHQ